MYGRNVVRLSQRDLHRHIRVTEAAIVVMRHPSAALYGRAAQKHMWSHTIQNRRSINEWLVGRTRLPQALGRVIKTVRVKVVSTDHAGDLAVVSDNGNDGREIGRGHH